MKRGDLVVNRHNQIRMVIDIRPCVRIPGETETLLMSPNGELYWYSTGVLSELTWKLDDTKDKNF